MAPGQPTPAPFNNSANADDDEETSMTQEEMKSGLYRIRCLADETKKALESVQDDAEQIKRHQDNISQAMKIVKKSIAG